MAKQHVMGLEYGALLWIRSNGRVIDIPLSILSSEQTKRLKDQIISGDLSRGNTNRARLVWEFFNQTDGGSLVDIEITSEQKRLLDPPKMRQPSKNSYAQTDFHALQHKLASGDLGWMDIIQTLDSLTGRPWATKAWKKKRDERIGSRCRSCGTDTGPMVLQHVRKRRKPQEIVAAYHESHKQQMSEWITANPPIIDLSNQEKTADACPECQSQVVRYRKTKGDWICTGVRDGIRCGHVFRVPVKQVSKWIVRNLESAAVERQKIQFLDQAGLGEQIAQDALNEMIQYFELKHTTTLCKRCAFVADQTKLVLCRRCRKQYHGRGYEYCSQCRDASP